MRVVVYFAPDEEEEEDEEEKVKGYKGGKKNTLAVSRSWLCVGVVNTGRMYYLTSEYLT